jgi:hypothetical protein
MSRTTSPTAAPTAGPDSLPPGTLASPTAASLLTGVAELTIIGWARAGRLQSEKIRGEWLVDASQVERLAAEGGGH